MANKQEFISFGPFVLRDLEPIKEYLESKGIEHRVRIDEELLKKLESQARPTATEMPRAFDPRYVFFEIDSRGLLGIGDDLETFGISWKPDLPEPDFSQVEYTCPDCPFSAPREDYCPVHRKRLLTTEQWNQLQREQREKQWERRLWKISIAIAVLMVASIGASRTFRHFRPWIMQQKIFK